MMHLPWIGEIYKPGAIIVAKSSNVLPFWVKRWWKNCDIVRDGAGKREISRQENSVGFHRGCNGREDCWWREPVKCCDCSVIEQLKEAIYYEKNNSSTIAKQDTDHQTPHTPFAHHLQTTRAPHTPKLLKNVDTFWACIHKKVEYVIPLSQGYCLYCSFLGRHGNFARH